MSIPELVYHFVLLNLVTRAAMAPYRPAPKSAHRVFMDTGYWAAAGLVALFFWMAIGR